MTRLAKRGMTAILTLVLILFGTLSRANAATYTVDDLGTDGDLLPGDGLCQTGTGTCTWYAALAEANELPSADTILLPAGTWRSITWVDYDLEVIGVGTAVTIIDGGRDQSTIYTGAVFMTQDNVSLTLRNITVRNGFSAVMTRGPLTIVDSLIRDHNDTGVWCNPAGAVTVINSTFSSNRGINAGGGLSCSGPIHVSGSTFNDNYAGNVGGGIAGAQAEIVGTTFLRNRAGNTGGAIHSDGGLNVVGSTFKSNSAFNVGGALSVYGGTDVRNSTFVSNGCGNTGGAIHTDGSVRLNNVTITGNTAGNIGSGISTGEGGSVTIGNSIVWGNPGQSCSDPLASNGYNFFDVTCPASVNITDHYGVNPLLGTLGNYGGPTQTIPLLQGSPAIDASDSGCEGADQRGIPRPQGAGCDSGAFETLVCDYDGVVDSGEQCDDGNNIDGDGCSSLCETELLAGRKLHLAGDATTGFGKLKVQLTDARVALGWGNFSVHDPVVYGGSIRVTSPVGGGIDLTLPLPAEGWAYVGKAGANRGYKYQGVGGVVQLVKIQPGRQIKLKGSGPLDIGLSNDPDPVQVILTIGSRHFCGQYGGETSFEPNRYFRAKEAPPPSAMP